MKRKVIAIVLCVVIFFGFSAIMAATTWNGWSAKVVMCTLMLITWRLIVKSNEDDTPDK